MSASRLHRRFTAWVALLALVLGALAPTVAQAMRVGADRGDWQEVCSVSGMVWVHADSAGQDPSSEGGDPSDGAGPSCPWCTLHGAACAGPAARWLPDPSPLPGRLSSAWRRAPLAAPVWAPAQSRAPPPAA